MAISGAVHRSVGSALRQQRPLPRGRTGPGLQMERRLRTMGRGGGSSDASVVAQRSWRVVRYGAGMERRWEEHQDPAMLSADRTHRSSGMRLSLKRLVMFCVFLANTVSSVPEDKQFWYDDGARRLREVLERPPLQRRARNVVLIVGDGMGLSTVTAGRVYRGQQLGLSGEEYQLAFEKFPHVGLAKTYNVDAQVGDSAACATALFCGVKTNYHRVGVDASSEGDGCSGGRHVQSLIDWAQQAGKSTGLVTNTRLTHSTPSATYGHVPYRGWESNSANSTCQDIARQLVENSPGRSIDVLFGGGRRGFLPAGGHHSGRRSDGRNLVQQWLQVKRRARLRPSYVSNKEQFDQLDPREVDSVLGLFSHSHMSFEVTRDRGPGGEPSLAEMTVKAIQILSKNENGFVLVVEAGRIDHGHHCNSGLHALSEVAALNDAVHVVLTAVDTRETLVVVTADHSHVFTFGGNRSPRGNPVLGQDISPDVNGLPYTTLLYGNGPGYVEKRKNLSSAETRRRDYRQEAAVPLKYETHAGEDVPVYAIGPSSDLFAGTYEQSYVAHAISCAAIIGPQRHVCLTMQEERATSAGDICKPIRALFLGALLVLYVT